MPEIRTEIVIKAPSAAIWQVITDVAAFAEWNPMAARGRGVPAPDGEITLWLRLGPGAPKPVRCRVYAFEPERHFCWGNGVAPLLTVAHYLRLEPRADGATLVRHGERFSGALGWPVRALLVRRARYEAFNRALRARVMAAVARGDAE